MYLTKSECNKLIDAGKKIANVCEDAAGVIRKSCDTGKPLSILQDFERCSQKWMYAFTWMQTACELTRFRMEEHFDEWLKRLKMSDTVDLMLVMDFVEYDIIPLSEQLPKAIRATIDAIRNELQWIPCDEVDTARKRLLMRRVKIMRTELFKYSVTNHEYGWMEIPAYEPPFPLLRTPDSEVYTGICHHQCKDEYNFIMKRPLGSPEPKLVIYNPPCNPIEKCSAIQARIWKYYQHLIVVIQNTVDCYFPLEHLQFRCDINANFLNELLEKELAHEDDRSRTEADGEDNQGGRPQDGRRRGFGDKVHDGDRTGRTESPGDSEALGCPQGTGEQAAEARTPVGVAG